MNDFTAHLRTLVSLLLVLGVVGCAAPSDGPSVTAVSDAKQGPLAGVVRGAEFECEDATLENGILTLRQGSEFFADLSLTMFLFLDEGEVPEGKTFRVEPGEAPMQPLHIHTSRVMKVGDRPDIKMAMSDFRLELEFGTIVDKKLPGTVRLEMDGELDTRVSGTFVADVKGFMLVDG